MMSRIGAIETVYNNYKFRSRLEARWAVFFDELGIEYEYEKEGYNLGELGWYLPDFWLPEFNLWVEVKPLLEFKSLEWLTTEDKAKQLRAVTGMPVLVVCGDPAETVWKRFYGYRYINCKCEECQGSAVFAKGDFLPFLMVFNLDDNWDGHDEFMVGSSEGKYTRLDRIKTEKEWYCQFESVLDEWIGSNFLNLLNAMESDSEVSRAAIKARRARFEHGEVG
jgi:hypothetical protein